MFNFEHFTQVFTLRMYEWFCLLQQTLVKVKFREKSETVFLLLWYGDNQRVSGFTSESFRSETLKISGPTGLGIGFTSQSESPMWNCETRCETFFLCFLMYWFLMFCKQHMPQIIYKVSKFHFFPENLGLKGKRQKRRPVRPAWSPDKKKMRPDGRILSTRLTPWNR